VFELSGVGAAALRVASLLIAALLLVALVHKVRVLAAGGAHEMPLIRLAEWRRRHAAVLLAFAAGGELVVAVLLVVVPTAGLGAATVVLGGYAWELRRLDPDQSCGCFGNFLRTTGEMAVLRNLVLAAISGAAFVLALSGVVTTAAISQATVGGTLVAFAVVLAVDSVARVLQPGGVIGHVRSEGGRLGS
jgi:hypothetical protein